MLRSLARFSIAVLIGVGATLAWQSYGDTAREMLSTQVPSLSWLSVSTTTSVPMAEGSAQKPRSAVSADCSDSAPAAAATTSEFPQLEPIARDLAAMRRSLEQLAAKQEQMAQNIATLQAAEQDIRQKMMLCPRRSLTNRANHQSPPRTHRLCSRRASAAARGPITLAIALTLGAQCGNSSRSSFVSSDHACRNPSVNGRAPTYRLPASLTLRSSLR